MANIQRVLVCIWYFICTKCYVTAIFLGVCIGLLGISFGGVAAFRGYSSQNGLPELFMFSGITILVATAACFSDQSKRNRAVIYAMLLLIYFSSAKLIQRYPAHMGENFYAQGHYAQAADQFEKVLNTWYYRLRNNHHEPGALRMLARSHCQLGDFEQGIRCFERLLKRYPTYLSESVQHELLELKTGLERVSKIEAELPKENPLPSQYYPEMMDLGRIYRYHLYNDVMALKTYQRALEMDIRPSRKETVLERISKLQKPSNHGEF